MIIDDIAHAARYAGLSAHFARAVRFLTETDMDALPCGSVAVDGENVYAFVQENMTQAGPPRYEAHDRYADIQVILDGRERFALGLDPRPSPLKPGTDFRSCEAEECISFDLGKGQLVIFLPGEAHAPGGAAGEPAPCRKMVVKVLCADEGSEDK